MTPLLLSLSRPGRLLTQSVSQDHEDYPKMRLPSPPRSQGSADKKVEISASDVAQTALRGLPNGEKDEKIKLKRFRKHGFSHA
ncbi:MAG: hypothetical protein EA381_09685 [Planctomycetaceae bacterium]|nr:MAG: hypothetical protein EA381_09685 [Planctomycetaceae bacterium]